MILKKKIGGEPPLLFSYKNSEFLNKKSWKEILYFSSGRSAIKEILSFEMITSLYIPEYFCYPVYDLIATNKDLNICRYNSYDQLKKYIRRSNTNERKLIIFSYF